MSQHRLTLRIGLTGALACALGSTSFAQTRLVPGGRGATPEASRKIEPRLIAATSGGQSASFFILTSDQADVSAAREIPDQDARGWYVYQTLKEHAERTQAGLCAFLDGQGIPYRRFWVANAILAYGSGELLAALAARNDVRALESNEATPWLDPVRVDSRPDTGPASGPEWGVLDVHAPNVWALGFTGQGIVIGNQDTGMQWDHPALQAQYRGWDGTAADHNYNWHDSIHDAVGNPCGNDSPEPCDDYGHGTHTTGTTSGDDGGGNQIGVAPGAQWIGCRNMDRGAGTPARYTECFEFFMAPTDLNGDNPDPTLRPHVINNSWVCPASEGCAPDTLETIVENTEAAGIFVTVSTGNSGPVCESVNGPPAIYDASFSVGAYGIGDYLAGFSSRGPVTVDGSGRLKPDVSAPGVGVRSSFLRGGYASLSGTSMAGPHVVGVVALLWSAVPELQRQVEATKDILRNTARPDVNAPNQTCGDIPFGTIPNNSFGYGAVDALAALNSRVTAAQKDQ